MDLKNIFSTICAAVIAICGGIAAAIQGGIITLPAWVMTVCILGGIIAGALIGVFQGKNPNLTAKTPRQVDNLNNEQAATKKIR